MVCLHLRAHTYVYYYICMCIINNDARKYDATSHIMGTPYTYICIYTTGAVTTAVGQMEQWEIIVGLLCSMYKNMF